jgi:hypothetical protein
MSGDLELMKMKMDLGDALERSGDHEKFFVDHDLGSEPADEGGADSALTGKNGLWDDLWRH